MTKKKPITKFGDYPKEYQDACWNGDACDTRTPDQQKEMEEAFESSVVRDAQGRIDFPKTEALRKKNREADFKEHFPS